MRIWLASVVRDAMARDAQEASPLESGGVLIGYWSQSREDAVITDIVGGGPRALRTKYSFLPDQAFQESEIARKYVASGRVATYLGDWHSHPMGLTEPSRLDRRTLKRIVRGHEARLSCALMVIVAGGPDWNIRVWGALSPKHLFGRTTVVSIPVHEVPPQVDS